MCLCKLTDLCWSAGYRWKLSTISCRGGRLRGHWGKRNHIKNIHRWGIWWHTASLKQRKIKVSMVYYTVICQTHLAKQSHAYFLSKAEFYEIMTLTKKLKPKHYSVIIMQLIWIYRLKLLHSNSIVYYTERTVVLVSYVNILAI